MFCAIFSDMRGLILFFGILIESKCHTFSQVDSSFSFLAYGDVYFSTNLFNQKSLIKPNYIYNHTQNNQLSSNLLLLKSTYNSKFLRGNLTRIKSNNDNFNSKSSIFCFRIANKF